MVIYFTGTGNSRFVAQQIALKTKEELISMKDLFSKEEIKSDKPFVFVCPTYAWGLPEIVKQYLQKVKLLGSRKVYMIITCGQSAGIMNKRSKKLFEKKGLELVGYDEVVMPSNYLILSNPPNKEKSIEIIKNSFDQIQRIANAIFNEEAFVMSRKKSFVDKIQGRAFINKMFHIHMAKDEKFYVKKSCDGCGKCERECPLNNISIEESKPKWNGSCTHCLGCIGVCPHGSIEYEGKSEGRNKYYLESNFRI